MVYKKLFHNFIVTHRHYTNIRLVHYPTSPNPSQLTLGAHIQAGGGGVSRGIHGHEGRMVGSILQNSNWYISMYMYLYVYGYAKIYLRNPGDGSDLVRQYCTRLGDRAISSAPQGDGALEAQACMAYGV